MKKYHYMMSKSQKTSVIEVEYNRYKNKLFHAENFLIVRLSPKNEKRFTAYIKKNGLLF